MKLYLSNLETEQEYLSCIQFYSDKQIKMLEKGVYYDVNIQDLKNPDIPLHVMECQIVAREHGYVLNTEQLIRKSLVFVTVLTNIMSKDYPISALFDPDGNLIDLSDRQILAYEDMVSSEVPVKEVMDSHPNMEWGSMALLARIYNKTNFDY